MIGCGHNAKNKLTVNYLYLAEKHGAVIHELQEVHEVTKLMSQCDGSQFDITSGAVLRGPAKVGAQDLRSA